MNDNIVKLALSITLLCITVFPIKKSSNHDGENDMTSKMENNITNVADFNNGMYLNLDENTNISWNDAEMNDQVFTESRTCKFDIQQ
ncbi:MAG: hypothetical protein WBP08_07520 [Saprospiraceae bacterium]